MTDDFVLDLDQQRAQRAGEREGKAISMPIRFGGETIATLPAELPVDVLAPLRTLDADITLILRQSMEVARGGADAAAKWDATNLVIDILSQNPALPVNVLDLFTEVGRNLLGEDGLAALLRNRPSAQDYAALAKGVFSFYGVSLGEASPSSDSSTDDGRTSSGTSSTTSGSTPEASGETPAPTGSWEPAVS